MTRRVLLTVDESTGPLAAARALRAGGFLPFVARAPHGGYAARSRAVAGVVDVSGPGVGAEEHAAAIAGAARRLGVSAVLPGTESSLVALIGREELFDVPVGTAPRRGLEMATDKAGLAEVLRPHGLRTPPSSVVRAGDPLDGVALPAIVKPVRTVSERGDGELHTLRGARVHDRAALREAVARPAGEGWLVQAIVAGRLSAVSGVAWRGRMVSALHQCSPLIWPPGNGVSALAVTVAPDAELEARIAGLLDDLQWSGIYSVQMLDDPDDPGGPWVIDINPRVYGSLALAVAAGHNLPAMWARLVLGEDVTAPAYRPGVGLRVEERYVRARADEVWRAVRGRAPLQERPPEVHNAVVAVRDPGPALDIVARTAAKLRRTVVRRSGSVER